MVKTYNEDKVAKGSGRRIEFTGFGEIGSGDNWMRLYKPARKSTGGKAPRKQKA